MTYNVFGGTLNPTLLYSAILLQFLHACFRFVQMIRIGM